MASWLEKILPTAPPVPIKTNVPVVQEKTAIALPAQPLAQTTPHAATLPAASVVYAVAASALFVISIYFLLTGRWFTGGLVLLPATCFLGFALHFLKMR